MSKNRFKFRGWDKENKEMIKELEKLEDFKNKKILFSDEVLEKLLKIDGIYATPNAIDSIKDGCHSLFIDNFGGISYTPTDEVYPSEEITSQSFFEQEREQEMFYSKELGFYVEVEGE